MKNSRFRKLLFSLVLVLMSAVSIFSGCNLVQTDVNAYYDRVVAKAGNVEITKRELLNYYSSALSNGMQYSVEDILEEVINRKLLIENVKANFKTYVEGIGESYDESSTDEDLLKRIVNKYYYNEAMQKAYDYIDSKILDYENTIRASRGDELIKEDEDSADTTFKPETVYEKKVKRDDEGNYYIVKEDVENQDTLKQAYDYTHEDHGDLATRTKAYNMFANALLRSEKGKGLDSSKENAILREIDRVYKIYADQTYLEFFQHNYEYNFTIDNNDVVNKYKELVKSSYSKFILEGDINSQEAYDKYCSSMQSDASKVYYHPYTNKTDNEGNRRGFVQVAHILIKFTKDQLIGSEDDEVLSWKEIYEQKDEHDDDGTWYNTELNKWLETCTGKARYTLEDEKLDASHKAGNEYGEAKSYKEIFQEITNELSSTTDVQKRAEIINKFIYKYGQDEGSINATAYYTVSLDSTVSDNWAGDFAKTCRDVYLGNSDGTMPDNVLAQGAGGYSKAYLLTNVIDKEGTYTFDEEKSYAGMDMVFVVGEYENLCDISVLNNLSGDFASTLYNTRVMLGVDKSWYDKLYDSITTSDYSTARQNKIDELRNDITIIYYKDAYKDLMA